jgi:hypothetical protein
MDELKGQADLGLTMWKKKLRKVFLLLGYWENMWVALVK